MLDFRPRGKQVSSSLPRSDKWRLLATVIASLMLLVIVLRLGRPPAERPSPSGEPQGQAEQYDANTLLIAIVTAVAVVVTLGVAVVLFQHQQLLQRRARASADDGPRPGLTGIDRTVQGG